jgi:hypothetical protein
MRVGFFSGKAGKIPGNIGMSFVLAVIFFSLYKFSPKPKGPPTLDQQANAFVDKLARQYPWLMSPPETTTQLPAIQHQEATMEFTKTELHAASGFANVFAPNHEATVVFGYENTSPGVARDVYAGSKIELLPRHGDVYTSRKAVWLTERDENIHFRDFRNNWLAHIYLGEGNDMERNNEIVDVERTASLTAAEVAELNARTKYLYAFGAIKWRDDTGSYETDLCWYYDGMDGIENGVQKVIWTKCTSGHYKVRRIFDPVKY